MVKTMQGRVQRDNVSNGNVFGDEPLSIIRED